jgi:hypothetical protein
VDGDPVVLLGEVDAVAGGLEFLGDTHCDFWWRIEEDGEESGVELRSGEGGDFCWISISMAGYFNKARAGVGGTPHHSSFSLARI